MFGAVWRKAAEDQSFVKNSKAIELVE